MRPSSPAALANIILDNLCDYAVFAIDTEGTILSWHPGVKTVLGYERDAFVDQPFHLLFSDADVKAGIPERELSIATETGRALDERWHVKADGSRFYAIGIVTALRDEQGELLGFAKVLRDAADRRALQEAQAAQADIDRRYRTLFNATDEGFSIIELLFDAQNTPLDYRFLEVNPQFERHTGIRDAAGKTARELMPNLEAHWFAIFGEVALTGEPRRFEEQAQGVGGGWFEVYAFRVDEENHKVGILFKDVSNRKQIELDLQASEGALAALNRDLESRVYERTQQVRDLAAQLTLAEARERARLAQVLHDNLQQQLFTAQFALRDARRVVTDTPEAVDKLDKTNDLIKEAVRIARTTTANLAPPVLEGEGLVEAIRWLGNDMKSRYDLEVTVIPAATSEVTSKSVRFLLFNLIRELLFNTVKHAEVKAAKVTVTKNDGVEITVSDVGKGFDPAAIDDSEGGGLGLSGMRKRLDLFGGRLEVMSSPEQGTQVTIFMPAVSLSLD